MRSLRASLIGGMATVALVLAAVFVLVTVRISHRMIQQVDDRLTSLSRIMPPPPTDAVTIPPPAVPSDSGSASTTDIVSDVYLGTIDDSGVLQTVFAPGTSAASLTGPTIDAADLPTEGSATFTAESADGSVTYRVRTEAFGSTTRVIAIPIDDVHATIRGIVVLEAVGLLVVLSALGAVCWLIIRLGVRPVRRMTDVATEIAQGNLAVRVPETRSGAEAAELAVALNAMLTTIERLLAEQAESEDRLRRFVADASHELRTPLTTVLGYAELYGQGGLRGPDELDDAMRRMALESARMGRLVRDMLALAHLEEDRPSAHDVVDLELLVLDAAADADVRAPGRHLTVDAAGPALVSGDEDQLRQVLANVVDNALAHTEPTAPLTLRLRAAGDHLTVEVEDGGAGMEPEVAARATERFFRADPARTRERGGSGLGLSIAASIVHAHGGLLTVDSTVDVGTTVRIDLPAITRTDRRIGTP